MRIKDSTLLIIALCTSFVGVLFLGILFFTNSLPVVTADELGMVDDGSSVQMKGRVSSVQVFDSVIAFSFVQECVVRAVSFDAIDVSVGDELIIEGEVSTYNGEKEIIVSSLLQQTI